MKAKWALDTSLLFEWQLHSW